MKVLYVLFVAIVVAAANEDANCPEIATKNCIPHKKCSEFLDSIEARNIPYPEDCHKFYKCSNGEACLLCCPKIHSEGSKRLVFNPEAEVCDWPRNVKNPGGICDNVNPTETTTSPTEPTTSPTETTTSPTETPTPSTKPTTPPTETTTSPTKPTTPPTETTTSPTKPTTPPTKPTTPPTETTTSPTKPTTPPTKPTTPPTKPTTPPTPPTSSTGTPREPNGCPSDGSADKIEDKDDCTRYYTCKDKKISDKSVSCGQGLVFNPKISSCDRPGNYPECDPRYFDN